MNDLDRAEIYALIRNIYRCQCQATHNASVSVANATWEVVALNSTTYDHTPHKQTPMHDNATHNSRIYARINGVYIITAQLTFASNATGYRSIAICLNSAGVLSAGNTIQVLGLPAHPSADTVVTVAATQQMSTGDYVEMFARQTSGGALNLLTYTYSPILSLSYLGE